MIKKIPLTIISLFLITSCVSTHQHNKALQRIKVLEKAYNDSQKEIISLKKVINSNSKKEKNKNNKEKIKDYGIWEVRNYIDNFGDITNSKYISTKHIIKGNFSNSATENSKLNSKIIIESKNEIYILLFEYSGNNPVKSYKDEYYSIYIKDKYSTKHHTSGIMFKNTDRIKLGKLYANKLHKALSDGGEVNIFLKKDNSTSEYNLKINNADGYANIYKSI